MFRIPKHRTPTSGTSFLTTYALIIALANAFIIPIFPLFIKDLVGKDQYVGYVISSFAVLILLTNLFIGKIISKFSKKSLMLSSIGAFFFAYFLFSKVENITQFFGIEIFRTVSLAVHGICLGILLRESTTKKKIGKTEGLYYTFLNVAWLIGPLVGGLVAKAYGFDKVFYISSTVALIAFVILSLNKLKEYKDHTIIRKPLVNLKLFLKNKKLLPVYLITFGLALYLSSLYIYLPLLIKENGLGEDIIGYALFALVIPLLLLEIPAGKLADKYGYKWFFVFGFLLISLFLIPTYFIDSLYTVIILLVLSGIGAAFIEPLKEAYFFKVVNSEDELKFYPIFRTAIVMASLLGPIIFSTFLFFIPLKAIFTVGGFITLLFSLICLKKF